MTRDLLAELHAEQCAHGATLKRLDALAEAVRAHIKAEYESSPEDALETWTAKASVYQLARALLGAVDGYPDGAEDAAHEHEEAEVELDRDGNPPWDDYVVDE